jgi:hypothetical protein
MKIPLEIYIEGSALSSQKNPQIMQSLNDKTILQQRGGFLLRMSTDKKKICLGILPGNIHGQRSQHYDISLPEDQPMVYSGMMDAQGCLSMLPLVKPGFDKKDPHQSIPWLQGLYQGIRVLAQEGLSPLTPLDWTLKQVLHDLGWKNHGLECLQDILDHPHPEFQ